MSITFAVRGDSLSARYSTAGNGSVSSSTVAAVATQADAGAIGGNSIQMSSGGAATRALIWNGRENLPGTNAFSVGLRWKPGWSGTPAVSKAILAIGGGVAGRNWGALHLTQLSGSGNLVIFQTDDAGNTGINVVSILNAWNPTAGTWYDFVITVNGTSVHLWIDGIDVGNLTSSFAFPNPRLGVGKHTICLGITSSSASSQMDVNELFFDDAVIDPTSVALVGGPGSLNGAARTAFVDVAAFDGLSYSDPTEAAVKTGTAYTFAGVAKNGTYTGSDRWTDPGEANVKNGVEYKANSTTNNKTGSLVSTDPGEANVLDGTAYTIESVAKEGTYVCAENTDPGVENVRSGTAYIIEDAPLVGTLACPAASDVRSGVVFDNDSVGSLVSTNPGVENVGIGVNYTINNESFSGEAVLMRSNSNDWTYEAARDKVLLDLDMQEEAPVEADELVGYFNDAIAEAEAEIHRLEQEEDYFLTSAAVDLVEGEEEYDLPSDIYARDVRRLMYSNESNIYPVRRFRGRDKFEAMTFARNFGDGDDYRYYFEQGAGDTNSKIILVPPARETSGDIMTLWYIRNARRIPLIADGLEEITLATVIDIPEFISFIFAFVKVKIIVDKMKEPGENFIADLQAKRQIMIDTLSGFRDDDDEIRPDLRAYEEAT